MSMSSKFFKLPRKLKPLNSFYLMTTELAELQLRNVNGSMTDSRVSRKGNSE